MIPVVGDRIDTARAVLTRPAAVNARANVAGRRPRSILARLTRADIPDELRTHAEGREIVFVESETR